MAIRKFTLLHGYNILWKNHFYSFKTILLNSSNVKNIMLARHISMNKADVISALIGIIV